jgi:hypothetical protein
LLVSAYVPRFFLRPPAFELRRCNSKH